METLYFSDTNIRVLKHIEDLSGRHCVGVNTHGSMSSETFPSKREDSTRTRDFVRIESVPHAQ